MGNVEIYHPETQARVVVPEESVSHYRQSGWLMQAEWNELQAAEDARKAKLAAEQSGAAAAPPSRSTAAKASGLGKEEK